MLAKKLRAYMAATSTAISALTASSPDTVCRTSARSYDEILGDLKPENVQDFETLVFDTAGKLISLMGLWAIKQNPKVWPA